MSLSKHAEFVGTVFLFSGKECEIDHSVIETNNVVTVHRHANLLDGIGTAFIVQGYENDSNGFRIRTNMFLATCKHCFVDFDTHGRNRARSCAVVFPAARRTLWFDLYQEDGSPLYSSIPDEDLALFSIQESFLPALVVNIRSPIVPALELGSDVLLLGYMRLSYTRPTPPGPAYVSTFNVSRAANGPVLKAGVLAHGIVQDGNEHYFFVDATGRGGMSGCPVFQSTTKVSVRELGVSNYVASTGEDVQFLGIYRGRESNDKNGDAKRAGREKSASDATTEDRLRKVEEQLERDNRDICRLFDDVDYYLDKDRTSEIGKVIPSNRLVELIQQLCESTGESASTTTAAAVPASTSTLLPFKRIH